MTTLITQRIRRSNGQVRGLLVAQKFLSGDVGIGFSLCKKTDKYDKDIAFTIAHNRACIVAHKLRAIEYPPSIEKDLVAFVDRAERYFKLKKE